jgi:hypothetical protein
LTRCFSLIILFSLKINFLSDQSHSRGASGRESRLFLRNTESPIKAFGEDEEVPVVTIKRQGKGRRK